MVHVFRLDGTVLSIPWDDVFFTLGLAGGTGLTTKWDIRGLVLDHTGETVKETFTFSMVSTDKTHLYQLWEFIRRYMEEGPQEVFSQIEYCLPIWDRRESYFFGLKRLLLNLNGLPVIQILMFPFLLVYSFGRLIAMWTSRIPRWPKVIEDGCRVAPGDPYAKDWRSNPK